MSINWITVAAQIVNFLVLVWLLKRFLYRPILDGIDAREKEIAERMAEAATIRKAAEAAEADHNAKIATLRASRADTLDAARRSAEAERNTLLAEARKRLAAEQAEREAQRVEEARNYSAELHRSGAEALLSLTRKALADLADETLEQRIVAHSADRLATIADQLREAAGDSREAVAFTRDPLPQNAAKRLRDEFATILPGFTLRLDTDATLAPGLTLRLGGAQVAWTACPGGWPMRPDARMDVTTDRLVQALLDSPPPTPQVSEIGRLAEVGDGIAIVTGLARALSDELLEFASGVRGIVFDLEPDRLGVVLLGPSEKLASGEDVRRTGRVVSVPVGAALLGRVVDALGRPRDDKESIGTSVLRPIEAEAPGILQRSAVARPLATGLKAIDATVPVGLGQRELIVGDRQTGKTSIAVDTILNQRETGVLCIYCAIGQRGDAVAKVIGAIKDGGMMDNSVIVVAGDEDAPGLAYIAPYAAMSMAESFAAEGRDVLVVMDDLTHHAHAYRELSLLLRRPPGREAFPGDIFYVHARLLERAGQFSESIGGGSITALPIVETQAENLSAYIPTNLISITDGQIYLSPRLVRRNQFPAVDLGVSVSRVGGKAQAQAYREVAGNLRVTLSQFEELEEFARFGTRLDVGTRTRLVRGAAVRASLRQPERDPMPANEQLAVLLAAMDGVLDRLDETTAAAAMIAIRTAIRKDDRGLGALIAANTKLSDENRAQIIETARVVVASGFGTHGADA